MRKASKYIRKYAWINIKHKKQRARLSIVAVCLSTAIIFTSLTLFKNIYHFSKSDYIETIGNYHYAFSSQENISLTAQYAVTKDGNTGYYGNENNRTFNLRTLDVHDGILPFHIVEGNIPYQENDLLVSELWGLTVGQEITLNYTFAKEFQAPFQLYPYPSSLNLSSTSRTFTVCGIYQEEEQWGAQHQSLNLCYANMPVIDDAVYYIKDSQIQKETSFTELIHLLNADAGSIVSNQAFIEVETIRTYLHDTTMLLAVLVLIFLLCIIMSLISIHNVVIISDKERKKELGLLKSIGATSYDIKKLLHIELIVLGMVGSLLGVMMGMTVSYFILQKFTRAVYMDLQMKMILNGELLFISLLLGMLLMYQSGMKAYSKYIYSTPINDLKESVYAYNHSVNFKDEYNRSFEFRMFKIYNKRMKSQTKNILHSFILLLSTTVLFMSIVLSNQSFKNKYIPRGYDFEITNYHWNDKEGPFRCIDIEVTEQLYKNIFRKPAEAKEIYVERTLMSLNPGTTQAIGGVSLFFYTPKSIYPANRLAEYTRGANHYFETEFSTYDFVGEQMIESKNTFCSVHFQPSVFDKKQLGAIKPYIIDGTIDNLGVRDVVLIYRHDGLCDNFKVGDKVYLSSARGTLGQEMTIKAIAVLPVMESGGQMPVKYYPFEKYPRVMAFSLETLMDGGDMYTKNSMGTEINEHFYIELKNEATARDLQNVVNEILSNTQNEQTYQYTNYVQLKEDCRMTTFLIESLLFPLFGMLFIVSMMNIHNVFSGNVHLKESDVSILKSVGMTNKQARSLFVYEYEEGYMNASMFVTILFVPLAMSEKYLSINSSFDFGANIIGTLFFSILFLGVLMVVPLVWLALHKVNRIQPLSKSQQEE